MRARFFFDKCKKIYNHITTLAVLLSRHTFEARQVVSAEMVLSVNAGNPTRLAFGLVTHVMVEHCAGDASQTYIICINIIGATHVVYCIIITLHLLYSTVVHIV